MLGIFMSASIFIFQSLFGIDFKDFDSYQCTVTMEEVEQKIKTYLEKDPAVRHSFQLTPQELSIQDPTTKHIDYVLKLRSSPAALKSHKIFKSLKGLRVAIDPGHFGGKYAELEERLIVVPAEKTKNHQTIRFYEGDLTYLTAIELQRLLEQEGAIVLVTRSGIGKGAIQEEFFEWLKKHQDLQNPSQPLSKIFRTYYNREDMRERAKKINAFSPDLTVVIHYNSHSSQQEEKDCAILTNGNFNLAFVPGSFSAPELKNPEDRYEFLRLILTSDADESVKLSESILKHLVNKLNVPLVAEDDHPSYLKHCIKQRPGIYSRNLALTRLIHGPVCYGEALVQNNQDEVYRLSTHDIFIDGIPSSKRLKDVSEAYFFGIKEYINPSK